MCNIVPSLCFFLSSNEANCFHELSSNVTHHIGSSYVFEFVFLSNDHKILEKRSTKGALFKNTTEVEIIILQFITEKSIEIKNAFIA